MSFGIESHWPLSPDLSVKCVEESRGLYQLLLDNGRSYEISSNSFELDTNDEWETSVIEASLMFEKQILCSRRTRNFKCFNVFWSSATQLSPSTVYKEIRVLDIINFSTESSRVEERSESGESPSTHELLGTSETFRTRGLRTGGSPRTNRSPRSRSSHSTSVSPRTGRLSGTRGSPSTSGSSRSGESPGSRGLSGTGVSPRTKRPVRTSRSPKTRISPRSGGLPKADVSPGTQIFSETDVSPKTRGAVRTNRSPRSSGSPSPRRSPSTTGSPNTIGGLLSTTFETPGTGRLSGTRGSLSTSGPSRTGESPGTRGLSGTGVSPRTKRPTRTSRSPKTRKSPRTGGPAKADGSPGTQRFSETDVSPRTRGAMRTSGSPKTSESPSTSESSRISESPSTSGSLNTSGSPNIGKPPKTGGSPSTSEPLRTDGSPSTSGSKKTAALSRTRKSPRYVQPSSMTDTTRTSGQSITGESSAIYESLSTSRTSPIYFRPLFKLSWQELSLFEVFLKLTQTTLYRMLSIVKKGIIDCIDHTRSLMETLQTRHRLDHRHESILKQYITKLESCLSRLKDCDDKLDIEFRLLFRTNHALETNFNPVLDTKNAIPLDLAKKSFKLREFFYYALEEFEKCLLESLRNVREIISLSSD